MMSQCGDTREPYQLDDDVLARRRRIVCGQETRASCANGRSQQAKFEKRKKKKKENASFLTKKETFQVAVFHR